MSSSPLQIQCSNPTCLHPANHLGQHLCDRCQMPLVYRHLWAIGDGVAEIPVNTVIGDRYLVKQPQVWLDTKPGSRPDAPEIFPRRILPYLHLFPDRLHIPELYGFYLYNEEIPVFLLDNVPLDETGERLTTLDSAWTTVSPVRQVYWLWQLLQLWQPLKGQFVATSLLIPDNIHVEGWRVRLLELIPDIEEDEEIDDTDIPTAIPERGTATGTKPEADQASNRAIPEPANAALTLSNLAAVWQPWIEATAPAIKNELRAISQQMQTVDDTDLGWRSIAVSLNRLLLEQSSQAPLQIQVSGATTTGPQRAHNEDACYPDRHINRSDALLPHLGIICDGIGGHEGGEVASQLALNHLKPLIRNLFHEFQERTELALPLEIEQDLESIVRIVNGAIAKQNDDQKRALRQRMGTTLVMALQLPQTVNTPTGMNHSHELYLVHVGDSRAYWLTPQYCHKLTIDDDVATREVRLGRSLYQEALDRPDGGALTQALGTRDSDAVHPTVRRFIIEESGILLLCSDGLSDNDRVEQTWEQITTAVVKGKIALEDAVQSWLQLADDYNGHDNTSVVMMQFQVGDRPDLPKLDPEVSLPFQPLPTEAPAASPPPPQPADANPSPDEELTEASRALLYGEEDEDDAALDDDDIPFSDLPASGLPPELERPKLPSTWFWLVALVLVAFIAGALGFVLWSNLLDASGSNSDPTSSPTQENPQ
jgi:protein phosphatase